MFLKRKELLNPLSDFEVLVRQEYKPSSNRGFFCFKYSNMLYSYKKKSFKLLRWLKDHDNSKNSN